jgi:hypothetical protein
MISLDAAQRKTFTDYIDDVSKIYVDEKKLFAAKGQQANQLAYRGDEIPNSRPYPADGEQRGTPTEMDWYYYVGFAIDIKFSAIKNPFHGLLKGKDYFNTGCPRVN